MMMMMIIIIIIQKVSVGSELKLSCRYTITWKYDYTILHRSKSTNKVPSSSIFLVFTIPGPFLYYMLVSCLSFCKSLMKSNNNNNSDNNIIIVIIMMMIIIIIIIIIKR